ncbi:MAG: UDP-N-acetylmuramoyl-tripeptide--D-alanyl-D-alanine ligase [Oscillospiraceae bacterium]|nr:UDP-N-acetylmuramoyl-tripeptide--D-alanyl-D-alanine ligase [Oscillospiraceae bacterium]
MRNGRITLAQAAQWCGGTVAPEYAEIAFSGANFDTRRLQKGELFVAIIGTARDGHDFAADAIEKGAAAVLASKPLAPEIPAIYVEDTVKALQDVARHWREHLHIKAVGVTGSVGKTTTKGMIASVLETAFVTLRTEENFNNGIGLPVTLLGVDEACEAAVLEMGMNHFGEISLLTRIAQPDIAVITNVGTMHIEYLGSREGILKAKLEILEGLRPGGIAIFNGDNDLLSGVAAQYHALTFGLGKQNDVYAEEIRTRGDQTDFIAVGFGKRIPITLHTVGEHCVVDALAAVAVGLCCSLMPEQIQEGLENFRNHGMRQKLYDLGSIHIMEDCYNAGPESMRAAFKVLACAKGRRIAVLGGMLELGSFAPREHYLVGKEAAKAADLLFAYGENSEEYVRGALEEGMQYARKFDTHEKLTAALQAALLPGDTVLFKGSRGMKMERVLQHLDTSEIGGKENG